MDPESIHWSFNLNSILDIKFRNSYLLVCVRTSENDINLWQYNILNNTYVRFSKNNKNLENNIKPIQNDYTLLNTNTDVSLDYFKNLQDEYFTLLNDNILYFYKIEFNNKFNVNYLNHSLSLNTENKTIDVDFLTTEEAVITLENDLNEKFITTLKSTNNSYSLFKSDLIINEEAKGYFIGENALLFEDNFSNGTSWSQNVSINNLIYSNNFNDIEFLNDEIIEDEVLSKKFNNNVWIAADQGTFIKSLDSGSNFQIVETGFRDNILSISFQDENIGLMVVSNNKLYSINQSDEVMHFLIQLSKVNQLFLINALR